MIKKLSERPLYALTVMAFVIAMLVGGRKEQSVCKATIDDWCMPSTEAVVPEPPLYEPDKARKRKDGNQYYDFRHYF